MILNTILNACEWSNNTYLVKYNDIKNVTDLVVVKYLFKCIF